LRQSGARMVGQGANHTNGLGPTGEPSVLPRHREIDFRLARKICRDLRIDEPTGSR